MSLEATFMILCWKAKVTYPEPKVNIRTSYICFVRHLVGANIISSIRKLESHNLILSLLFGSSIYIFGEQLV